MGSGPKHTYSFVWTGRHGAIAVLLEPGRQYFVVGQPIRRYIHEHYVSWCDFARGSGFDLEAEDIIFVSGWVKTSRWALATFTRTGRKKTDAISLRLSSQGFSGPTFTFTDTKGVSVSMDQRSGPPRLMLQGVPDAEVPASDPPPLHQTVFLRYYKVKRRRARRLGLELDEARSTADTSTSSRVTGCITFPWRLSLLALFKARFMRNDVRIEEGPYERVSRRLY